MSKLAIQVFLAIVLSLSAETIASVDIPSEDSDLTKSLLDASGAHFFSDDDDDQTSVKSESQNSDIYGKTQAEQLNEQLSVLDVLLRKRRTEPSTKSEEKVLEIPHADQLPIKDDVSDYVANNNPSSIQDDKTQKESTEERAQVRPITVKLTSSTYRGDDTAKDKKLDNDKTEEDSVKIIVNPIARVVS